MEFKLILITLLLLILSGCSSFQSDDDVPVNVTNDESNSIPTSSQDKINGYFPTLNLRDVLFNAGVLFNRPTLGTIYLSAEEIDNIICTNNLTLILTNFELKSTGELFSFDIYESPNVSSLGILITNPSQNVNRQSNITSGADFYILPTIIDDGTLIFSDSGLGTKQTKAQTSELFQDFLFKQNECYNFKVINGDNQAQTIFSQFEWAEIESNLSVVSYTISIEDFIEG